MTLGASQRWCRTASRSGSLPANRSSQSTFAIFVLRIAQDSAGLTQTGMHSECVLWGCICASRAQFARRSHPPDFQFCFDFNFTCSECYLFRHCLRYHTWSQWLCQHCANRKTNIQSSITSCPTCILYPICTWPRSPTCLTKFTRFLVSRFP